MRKGASHSAKAAAVVAAAAAGQIETLFEIMWEEIQDFLYRVRAGRRAAVEPFDTLTVGCSLTVGHSLAVGRSLTVERSSRAGQEFRRWRGCGGSILEIIAEVTTRAVNPVACSFEDAPSVTLTRHSRCVHGATLRSQICFILRDMIRGTKMFKDYGHKIPVDKWADEMGKLLKNRTMMNRLEGALTREEDGEDDEDD
jgi:hypothetical protein